MHTAVLPIPHRTRSYLNRKQSQYTQKVDFAQLKSEPPVMEKNDLATMKAESDRLASDLERLRQRFREDIMRTQAGVRLDLNLEKGAYILHRISVTACRRRHVICTN